MLAQKSRFSDYSGKVLLSDSGQRVAVRKAELRAGLHSARRGRPAVDRAVAAKRVQAALAALLASFRGATVAGYAPIGTEPGGADLPAVLRGLLPPDRRLLLPVLRADAGLDWAVYRGELVPARRGLREPPGPRLGPAAIGEAALVVVPALAVDHRGVRLGRDGGGYDRALAWVAPEVAVVALLYDGELRDDDLPVEAHDRRVTAVITPDQGLVRLPAGDPAGLADDQGGSPG